MLTQNEEWRRQKIENGIKNKLLNEEMPMWV